MKRKRGKKEKRREIINTTRRREERKRERRRKKREKMNNWYSGSSFNSSFSTRLARDILTNKQQAYASRELTKTWLHGWERMVSSILVGPMDIYIPNECAERAA